MTCRIENGVTYLQSYNVENRMSGISIVTGDCNSQTTPLKEWQFVYDGDGVKVKQVLTDRIAQPTTVTTNYYYAGGAYELEVVDVTETVRQYYSIAGTTVAMREGETWSWFLTDHLGSVVGVTDASGVMTAETRYLPFGEARTDVGTAVTETDFGYTFQRVVTGSGLMDYKARAYDPWLGRFVQPDTIIPGAGNPQAYNRYGYVLNSPINYNDPSGHKCVVRNAETGSCDGDTLSGTTTTSTSTPTPTSTSTPTPTSTSISTSTSTPLPTPTGTPSYYQGLALLKYSSIGQSIYDSLNSQYSIQFSYTVQGGVVALVLINQGVAQFL